VEHVDEFVIDRHYLLRVYHKMSMLFPLVQSLLYKVQNQLVQRDPKSEQPLYD